LASAFASAIEFYAVHFHELPSNALSELTHADLEAILSNARRRIVSEDSLFCFIRDRAADSFAFWSFLEFI
jgi:hypothetical protein